MPRKIIKRFMPDVETIRTHKHLQIFGTLLHDPNLWHLNRHSVSTAFAIGLFMAFMPMPFQMMAAAPLAIFFRANMPIAIALVWVSNPVTIPPIFYFCYKIGAWTLGLPPMEIDIELSWEWLTRGMLAIWQPFLLGCFIIATVSSITGYIAIRGFWRWHVMREWQQRKERREQARAAFEQLDQDQD